MISALIFLFIDQLYWYVDEKIHNRLSENVNVFIIIYILFITLHATINAK